MNDRFENTPRHLATDPAPLLDWLRLNLVRGLGPRSQQKLLQAFGSPANVFAQSRESLQRVSGIGSRIIEGILSTDRQAAEQELAECEDWQIDVLSYDCSAYPQLLREIPDPPSVLYTRGRLQCHDEVAIAIVGSRRCSRYGIEQAERLAYDLAGVGVSIVSGLARGIDAAAHRGALRAGGRTIAVCATGVNTVYPPEHAELAEEIVQQGALVTECSLKQAPVPGLFPQRNRIISGLSLGVIVVEAAISSGAMHTVRHAMEQGREVFAVPGRVDSPGSEGCLSLIREGVTLVRSAADVLSELGPLQSPLHADEGETVHTPRELALSDVEKQVLNLVPEEADSIDRVIESAAIDSAQVISTLTMLEMKQFVVRMPGGLIVRSRR